MATAEITKNPSRKKAPGKLVAAPKVTAPKKAAPIAAGTESVVVDVPTNRESDVKKLTKDSKTKVESYLKKNFNGVSKEMVDAIARECAECFIYQRTAVENKHWTKDIIEEVLLNCFPAANAVEEAAHKTTPKKTVTVAPKKAAAEPKKEAAAEEKKAESVSPPEEKSAGSKRKANKLPSATKKAGKKVVKAKGKTAGKKTKGQPKVSGRLATEIDALMAQMKEAKGVTQFEFACAILKRQRLIWMQAQDIPAVADHLYKVHTGKAKLEPKLPGKGEKSYAKRRLVKTLELIKDLI